MAGEILQGEESTEEAGFTLSECMGSFAKGHDGGTFRFSDDYSLRVEDGCLVVSDEGGRVVFVLARGAWSLGVVKGAFISAESPSERRASAGPQIF